MADESTEERYRKLRRLAEDARTPEHEARLAGVMAAALIELNPELKDIGAGDQTELDISYATAAERETLVHLAGWMGLEAYEVSRRFSDGKNLRKRKRRVIRLVGPRDNVTIALGLWPTLRKELKIFIRGTVSGWLWGAMEYELETDPDRPGRELSPTESAGFKAGYSGARPFANPLAAKLEG